jgi:hypothetical protein
MKIMSEVKKGSESNDASKWISWTYVFATADGILRTIYVELKKKNSKLCVPLFDVHKALQEVCNEFAKVANDIKDGKPIPAVELPTPEISDWGDDSKTADGIIEMLTNVVNLVIEGISKKQTGSDALGMVLHALAGLENALKAFKTKEKAANDSSTKASL